VRDIFFRIKFFIRCGYFDTAFRFRGYVVDARDATDIGHLETTASYIIGIMSGLTVAGKVATGFIVDRWGIRRSIVLTFTTIAVGIFLLMGAKDLLIARIFAVVFGFAIGAPLITNPALTAECLGLKSFGAIFGVLTLLITVGVAIGAVFTGVVFDVSESYMPAFSLFIILIAIAGFCGVKAKKAYSVEPVPAEGGGNEFETTPN